MASSPRDRKSTRLNSSHLVISYAVFCLKKKTELGWGGYWTWDPVEKAALMPWLCATAFIHSIMIQEKRGMLKIWNVSFFFFFNDTATTEIYTLSLHDALPICEIAARLDAPRHFADILQFF